MIRFCGLERNAIVNITAQRLELRLRQRSQGQKRLADTPRGLTIRPITTDRRVREELIGNRK
jgi:hypothetical protein